MSDGGQPLDEARRFDIARQLDIVRQLGDFAANTGFDSIPESVRERVRLMLVDLIGVTIAGARTPELRAFRDAWRPESGPAWILGAGRSAGPDVAAMLNGTAACALELDEGNKNALGHPAAHVAFAALAQVSASLKPVSGRELIAAIVVGYEIAARFGGALDRDPALHTHGHWGTTGAGAGAARLNGLDGAGIGAAIDAASGLCYVTPWPVVLAGSFVRNLWAAGSNVAGLVGARLAAAGLSKIDGTVFHVMEHVGTLDPAKLTAELGTRWDIARGYFKRQSACSYTHPAIDVTLEMQQRHHFSADDVAAVTVRTHRLTMPLAPLAAGSRLAAMFSVPYVVAAAIQFGQVGPGEFSAERRTDGKLLDLARRIRVLEDPALNARLPTERAVVVEVSLKDGRELRGEAPNPVGDTDYFPMDAEQVGGKIDALIGSEAAARVSAVVSALPEASNAAELLSTLP